MPLGLADMGMWDPEADAVKILMDLCQADLRCMHGYGLCLWRLRRFSEAAKVFERILSLNPNDNQGVRFCLDDVQHGLSWEDMHDREERAHANLRAPRQNDLDIN